MPSCDLFEKRLEENCTNPKMILFVLLLSVPVVMNSLNSAAPPQNMQI